DAGEQRATVDREVVVALQSRQLSLAGLVGAELGLQRLDAGDDGAGVLRIGEIHHERARSGGVALADLLLDHREEAAPEAGAGGGVLGPGAEGLEEAEAALGEVLVDLARISVAARGDGPCEASGSLVAQGDGAAVATERGQRLAQLERARETVVGGGAG